MPKFVSLRQVLLLVLPFAVWAVEPPAWSNPCKRPTPEAERLLAELAKAGEAWRPHTDHIHFFPRAQLKYSLTGRYLHAWYERPLYHNSAWRQMPAADGGFPEPAWAKTVEMVHWGLMDGLAAVPTQPGRQAIVPSSERADAPLTVLWELPYYLNGGTEASEGRRMKAWIDHAEKALASPRAFRMDGKVVLSAYPPIGPDQLEPFVELRRILRERFGDKFIVMPYGWFELRGDYPRGGPIGVEAIEKFRAHVREFLRRTDGYFYCGYGQVYAKRYDAGYFRDIVVPVVRSVMAEPEFAGRKYLGLNLHGGHENTYHFAYSMDSTGTRYLRESLECAGLLRPDFTVCCEWDEQNENTFFRPIVSSGHVIQRIFRHYVNRFAGRAQTALPGDDTSIPNLALTYRKALVPGEPIEIEVLNIPDGTFAGKTFTVSVTLRDIDGKTVKTFPPQKLSADVCAAARFDAFASTFADARALSPELTVETENFRRVFSRGFWPLAIRTLRNADHKWVRQPLRDMAWGAEGELSLAERLSDGTCVLALRAASPKPFVSVEVMDGPDTVYMHGEKAATYNPKDASVRVRIASQGTAASSRRYVERFYQRAPKSTIGFDFGDGLTGRVSVAEVAQKGAVGYAGPGGRAVVASRWHSVADLPPPCGGTNVEVRVRVDPLGPSSVFCLRIVDADHRVWCSPPLSCTVLTGRQRRYHVFERDAETVSEVVADEALVPDLVYSPPAAGDIILRTSTGRDTWGLLGGGAPLITGLGGAELRCGNVFIDILKPGIPGVEDTTPLSRTDAAGRRYLEFGACRFAHLVMPTVPTFAGFELTIDVFPEDDTREQGIVCANKTGIRLKLEKGLVPKASFAFGPDIVHRHFQDTNVRGPALRKGAWNRVRVAFDQRTAQVFTNGQGGPVRECRGYQWNQGYSVMGADVKPDQFFVGRLGELRIVPR